MPQGVHRYLEQAGIQLHSSWTFDVPERFDDPRELYKRLAWAFDEPHAESSALQAIEQIWSRDPRPALRHRRFLWKAEIAA